MQLVTSVPANLLKALDKDFTSSDDVRNIAKRYGFKRLGSGAYSETFGSSKHDFVIKSNLDSDPAAYKYYCTVMSMKSKYFPKIIKLKSYVDSNGSFLFVVLMERLHKMTKDAWKQANKDGRGFTNWLVMNENASLRYHDKEFEKLGQSWADKNLIHVNRFNTIVRATAGWAELDLHEDNLMMRMPKGDVVLSDPLAVL